MDAFDYIIIGAGSSGCVLANRLSADPRCRVLLIEDGGSNQHPFIKMAGGFVKIMGRPDFFRSYPVVQQPGRRKEMHAYGRGLGGSSAINGTWYLTGMPEDYDGWAKAGLRGWNWDEIARCFRQIEDYRDPGAHPGRGQGGELEITASDYASPVFDALAAAFAESGMPWVSDITAPGITGAGRSQYTVSRSGVRESSYEAFVRPIRSRPNLRIMTETAVKRIMLAGGRATGVCCDQAAGEVSFGARREVIVSAGVYGSPQLLQLSGIGPGTALQGLGLETVRDLPAVGANFCDHQKLGVSFDLNAHPGTNREFVGWRLYANAMRYALTRRGPLARVGMPITGLISSEDRPDWPDLQIAAAPFAMRTVNEMAAQPGSPLTARPGLTFSGYHLRPRSRGTVTLTTPSYRDAPLIDPKMWSDPYDQDKIAELFGLFRKVAAQPSLARYIGAERMPGAAVIGDQLVADLRKLTECGLHGTGTCSMGTDARQSVTDDRCRVHGVGGLRVVDCSIMPTPVSGNTNGPAMALAQRAAELIIEDGRG